MLVSDRSSELPKADPALLPPLPFLSTVSFSLPALGSAGEHDSKNASGLIGPRLWTVLNACSWLSHPPSALLHVQEVDEPGCIMGFFTLQFNGV